MSVTINDLRVDWLNQIKAYDLMIEQIEKEGLTVVNNDGGKPLRQWVSLVRKWRTELIQMLEDYPQQSLAGKYAGSRRL